MKRSSVLMSVACGLLVVLLALAGCANQQTITPRQTFADVNDTFITAVTVLSNATQTGALSKADAQVVVPYVVAADKLIDAYDAATKAGLDGSGVLDQIKAALIKIAPFVDQMLAKGVKPNVSSSSSSPGSSGNPGSGGSHQQADYQVSGRTRSLYRATERGSSYARLGAGGSGRTAA
jgi:hypothetical protein